MRFYIVKKAKILTSRPFRALILPCFAVELLLTSQGVFGAEWVAAPTVQIKAQYDDNLYLNTGSHNSVWGGTVSPRLTLSRNEENNALNLEGRLMLNNYSNSSVNDSNAQILTLGGHYQTERDKWHLSSYFQRDTTETTVSGVVPSSNGQLSDQSADIDVNLVPIKVRRNRFYLRPSWTHSLSERSALSVDYRLYQSTFANTGGNGLIDYRHQDITAGLNHSITERDWVGVTASASIYEALESGGTNSHGYGISANWSHQFSQTLRGNAAIGSRTTTTKVGGQNQDTHGLLFDANLVKRYSELTTYRINIGRSVQPSGAGVVQSDQVRVQWFRNLSPRMAGYLWGTFFHNKALGQLSSTANRTYYSLEPGLRWSLTRRWSLDGSYRYRRQKYDNSSKSAASNAVFIAVSYDWPRIAASR